MKCISYLAAVVTVVTFAACSDDAGPGGAKSTSDGGSPDQIFASGEEVRVTVSETGRAFVKLSPPSVVAPSDPTSSKDWDLAFEGLDIFTNGGVSGTGQGASFGPLDATEYLSDKMPVYPFLLTDKTGGAFLDWYAYESSTHALYSRYHVVGVKDGDRFWKVQILGYYGERDGATIAALYRVRYAELLADGAGPTVELTNLDGTAGGTTAPPSAASECLDFGSGARTMLGTEEALASKAWHVCFRRSSISVNGESGGPRGIGAVDLGSSDVASEPMAAIKARTAASELPAFDAANRASFTGRSFRGDHVVSGFGDVWIDRTKAEIAPAFASWIVADATGQKKYLVAFTSFERPTERSPGVVVMRVKPVKG